MADREIVDELLDRWEAAADAEPSLPPDEFLRRQPGPHTAGVRDEFLRRAAALVRADRRLDALRPHATAASPLAPGFEPIPGYRLDRPLGAGGFGQVWRASGPGGVPAALKFVPLGRAVSATEWRAVRLMKEVRHPHLIAVAGAWEAHGYLVVAMEPADGSLADRLRECVGRGLPGVPRDELLAYLADAASALDHLNEPRHPVADGPAGGIQHRDVKPQNLLLLGGGVKVADFGLARALTGGVTGHTGSMTTEYAAPEFFEGRTSAHSDQYSLAVTYCHLRGGRLPFVGTPAEVMLGHLKKLPDLSMLPPAEQPALARALAKKPEDRWPSCAAFVAALRESAAADGSPPVIPSHSHPADRQSHAPGRAASVSRTSRRRILIVTGAILVALGLGIVALLRDRDRVRGTNPSAPGSDAGALPPTAGRFLRRIDVGERTNAVAVAPDGRHAACGGGTLGNAKLSLFDLETGVSVRDYVKNFDIGAQGHHGPVRSVSFSPDGATLCAAGEGGAGDLLFWRVETGRHATSRTGRLAVYAATEPVVLVVDYESSLHLYRNDQFLRPLVTAPARVTGVALSPDGAYALACTADGQATVWEVKARKEVGKWDVTPAGHNQPGFTPDGRRVLVGTRVYAVPEGREVSRLVGPPTKVTAAALSRDGRRAAAATSDRVVIVWVTETGKEVCRLSDCQGDVRSVAFTPDGSKVVAVATDGGLYVWEVPVG